VPRGRHDFVDHARVDGCSIGRNLDRRRAERHSADEESPRRRISALADQHVDDLPVLIDGPVEVGPAAGNLDIRFVGEPTIPDGVSARAARRR
jgi:hypothetical protein